ncbi:MAG: helix-turn-helix domain-containing protein [Acidiferrobacterales bacterium]
MAHVTKGNVFRDLGFDREEAEDLAMRTYLMAELRKFIKKHKMTQAEAAEFFGIPRPKISYIQNGKIDKLSIDYLVRLLSKTGGRLNYSFKQPTKKQVEAARDAA